MTTAQLTFSLNNITPFHHSKPFLLPITITPSSPVLFTSLPQKPSLKSRKPLPLCFAGGKGGMMQNNENSPWKSLTNAMEKFKGKSIEDVLRQQIQKGEYLDNGGSGSKPPGGGGGDGGSGGGRPDDTGDSEDESFLGIQDETLQVILATGALLSFYVYLLRGKFIIKLIWDLIKCVSGGGVSSRLSKILRRLGVLSGMGKKKEVVDEYWLEKQILRTPTWWYDPRDYRRAVRNYYASSSASEPDGDVDEDANFKT